MACLEDCLWQRGEIKLSTRIPVRSEPREQGAPQLWIPNLTHRDITDKVVLLHSSLEKAGQRLNHCQCIYLEIGLDECSESNKSPNSKDLIPLQVLSFLIQRKL